MLEMVQHYHSEQESSLTTAANLPFSTAHTGPARAIYCHSGPPS